MGCGPQKILDEQIVRIFPSNQIAMRHLLFIAGILLGISPKSQATQGTVSEAQPLFRATKAPVELATARAVDTQGLRLDLALYESLRGQRPGNMSFELPFPGLGLSLIHI